MVFETFAAFFALHWILVYILLGTFLWQTGFRHRSYFRDQGVPYLPGYPVFGSQWRLLTGQENIADAFQRYYQAFPGKRFFGLFEFLYTPVYVIRDPELIKQIAIKDFENFVNHRTFVSHENDPLLGRSMFVMRDAKWRDMRSTVSPAFTGSKMRLMLSLVSECAERVTQYLLKEAPSDSSKEKNYDLRDLFTRYANDAIASSAFGLEVDSLVTRDNEFYQTGVSVTNFSGFRAMKFLFFQSIPKIMKFLRMAFFSARDTEFFRNLVHGTMKYREENNVVRHDMIHLMMQAKKGMLAHSNEAESENRDMGFATVEESDLFKSKKLTQFEDDDLVAQCMIFFLAGFNAISMSQCFAAHELAVNPVVQAKLFAEISEADRELNGKPLNYETLQRLKYLDQVVSETLRRWPLAPIHDRYVNAPYKLQNDDGTTVQLNVGDAVVFAVNGMHMDAKYFPDPERFDPERFSDENKDNIQPGTYLPFGIGPRNCIGSRYALMGTKAMIYHLVLNFSLEKCEKTQDPLILKKSISGALQPERGFWIELRPRPNRVN